MWDDIQSTFWPYSVLTVSLRFRQIEERRKEVKRPGELFGRRIGCYPGTSLYGEEDVVILGAVWKVKRRGCYPGTSL